MGILVLLVAALAGTWSGQAVNAAPNAPSRWSPGVYVQNDWEGLSLRVPWAVGSAVRVGWRQLEPREGRYDFSSVDAWLEHLAKGGK